MVDKDIVARLRKLFNGLQRAHGVYDLTGAVSPKGKAQGKASTVVEDITDEHWYQHLEGEKGLGIVPIMDDANCGFGVIDIDTYPLDLVELEKKIRALHLPLVVCRTKSGGAHCCLFLVEPVRADYVRVKLAEWAIAIGHPGVEIFPKQDAMASTTDVGNWINLPYFDAHDSARYAVFDGVPQTLQEFVSLAEEYRTTYATMQAIELQMLEELFGGPPCLQSMCNSKIPEGTRNDVMFAMATFAKLKHPNDWEQQVDDFNRKFFAPSLGHKEMADIVKSHKRKEYFYPCKKEPFKSYCNAELCKLREYGISKGEASDPGVMITGITQITTEPPIWFVTVNGSRMQITSDDLLSQQKFAKRVLDSLRILPQPLRTHKWRDLINNLLQDAEVVIAPQDAGPEGLFWHYLEKFCTQRGRAKHRDELLLGKPYTENGRTFFRSADLMRFLDLNKFRDYKANQVYATLRNHKSVSHDQFNLKGACVQCWSISEFPRQEEAFIPPVSDAHVDC